MVLWASHDFNLAQLFRACSVPTPALVHSAYRTDELSGVAGVMHIGWVVLSVQVSTYRRWLSIAVYIGVQRWDAGIAARVNGDGCAGPTATSAQGDPVNSLDLVLEQIRALNERLDHVLNDRSRLGERTVSSVEDSVGRMIADPLHPIGRSCGSTYPVSVIYDRTMSQKPLSSDPQLYSDQVANPLGSCTRVTPNRLEVVEARMPAATLTTATCPRECREQSNCSRSDTTVSGFGRRVDRRYLTVTVASPTYLPLRHNTDMPAGWRSAALAMTTLRSARIVCPRLWPLCN